MGHQKKPTFNPRWLFFGAKFLLNQFMKFYEAHHYQPKVDAIFKQLKLDLDQLLKDARIEHIGSPARLRCLCRCANR
jgi:hypothetical protein